MISKIDITGISYDVSDDLDKYIRSKIGKLDKYIPRSHRKSVFAEVKLSENDSKNQNRNKCEVILHVYGELMTAKESTINMFAAVDIVEAKLKSQLRKYKDKRLQKRKNNRKGAFGKIRGMASKDFWGSQD